MVPTNSSSTYWSGRPFGSPAATDNTASCGHRFAIQTGDFWPQVSRIKRLGESFGCALLDPPFFSTTGKGKVDLAQNSARLTNKVRPLVDDGGWLVTVNNALFVSGAEYMQTLEALCADGHLQIERLIPVPPDFTGFPQT